MTSNTTNSKLEDAWDAALASRTGSAGNVISKLQERLDAIGQTLELAAAAPDCVQ